MSSSLAQQHSPSKSRPDIQALRALAIVSVLVFHLWPDHFKGGFVGVDIFFVISGFLISGQLWREIEATGQVKFANFWARRARRLLPASLVVIFATALTMILFVPPVWFLGYVDEALGSIAYVQNWVLASKATDYLAANTSLSPFLHFWSLSVEEQYYIFWPLILGSLLIFTKIFRAKPKVLITAGLAGIFVISLFYSIALSIESPELAYFSTFTRAWEFAGGAFIAVIFSGRTLNRHLKAALVWVGIALMLYAFLKFNSHTVFPGYWAAVPVFGAMAFLLGGDSRSFLAPWWLFRFWPIQFLGDISYSLYLWHWPIIVLAPWVLHQNLTTSDRVAIAALAILLGYLSKRFVEDPIRFGRLAKKTPRNQLLTAASAMALIVGAIFGGAAFAQAGVDSSWSDKNLHPSISKVATDFPKIERTNCRVQKNDSAFSFCVRGDKNGSVQIGIFGDSHARQYFAPLEALALEHHWRLVVATKNACPLADAQTIPSGVAHPSCKTWNTQLEAFIKTQPKFDLIINSTSTYVTGNFADTAPAYKTEVQRLISQGSQWLVILDNPKPLASFIACVSAAGQNSARDCGLSREHAMSPADLLAPAVKDLAGVTYADYTDAYCSATSCPPVINNIVVYRDDSHISATFSMTLKGRLEASINQALQAKGATR